MMVAPRSARVRQHVMLALAAAAAALQIGVAVHGDVRYLVAVTLAWTAALGLWVQHERHAPSSGWFARITGTLILAGACALSVLLPRPDHGMRTLDRLLPIAAGLGLGAMAFGFRALRDHWRIGVTLCVPLITPLPYTLLHALVPHHWAAVASAALLHIIDFPVIREGILLHVPGATVEVAEECGGMTLTSQLLALAVVVACLFPTTRLQKGLLALSAIASGFAGNALRLAYQTAIASVAPGDWEFWHHGTGSQLFPITTTAVACLSWWIVMRRSTPVVQDPNHVQV